MNLFGTSSETFLPHGVCLSDDSGLIGLHAVSDSAIFLSYLTIQIALLIFVARRGDLKQKRQTMVLTLFILACGVSHLLSLITLWVPLYEAQGVVKLLTAAVSIYTAVKIWPLLPVLLAIPSPRILADKNAEMEREVIRRRFAEQDLDYQVKILRSAARLGHMGYWSMDAATQKIHNSPELAQLLGRDCGPAGITISLDQAFRGIVEEDREGLDAKMSLSLNTGASFEHRVRLYHEDGRIVHMMARGEADRRNGEITGLSGVAQDITALVEALEGQARAETEKRSAEQASATKTAFVSHMSHELRTPLNAIIGYSELLTAIGDRLPPETVREDLDHITSAGRHLLELINNILDMAKIESGHMELSPGRVTVAEVIEDVRPIIQPLAEANGNGLDIIDDTDNATLLVDCTKLRQMLINLAGNAAKFAENGTVTIHFAPGTDDHRLRLTVRDTGIGMTPEQMALLFQAYRQGDNTVAEKYGGTGLGLAITRGFCELMGGTITADSHPGDGTVFTMDLPVLCQTEPIVCDGTVAFLVLGSSARDTATANQAAALFSHGSVFECIGGLSTALTSNDYDAVVILTGGQSGKEARTALSGLLRHCADQGVRIIVASDHHYRALAEAVVCVVPAATPFQTLAERVGEAAGIVRPLDVLIVEDDPHTRGLLARHLGRAGASVVTASSAEEAMDAMGHVRPDVMVVDLLLPSIDGFELIRRAREALTHPRSIVVLTSLDLTAEQRADLADTTELVLLKRCTSIGDAAERISAVLNGGGTDGVEEKDSAAAE